MGEKLRSGESREVIHRNAGEALNEKLFDVEQAVTFEVGDDGMKADATLGGFPEMMVEEYGFEESVRACEAKLGGAKVATEEENAALYNSLNEDLLDLGDEAAREGYRGKEAYADLLRGTLDGLLADVKDYGDGEVQSLESVANHKIARETKVYLNMAKAGSMTEGYRAKYAERMTALTEVRGLLNRRRKGEFWLTEEMEPFSPGVEQAQGPRGEMGSRSRKELDSQEELEEEDEMGMEM